MSYSVVITADRGSFTDYSRSTALGYVACMPYRLVPRIMMDKIFAPELKTGREVEAKFAPYALRKVEASVYSAGIKSVGVVPPSALERAVDSNTKVVGISVHDPYGLSPVSTKLTMLFGGGPSWTARFFEELGEKVSELKKKYGFRVIVGGPGVWQMSLERPDWVDVVFNGEVEVDMPKVINDLVAGREVPRIVNGRNAPVEQIPTIIKPSRMGEVQITRGCPRGCQFCSITPETFRTIPMEQIKRELSINIAAGETVSDLITDDIMLYGSKRLGVNHEAIVNLFSEVKKMGIEQMYFSHISAPPVVQSPETVEAISHIAEYDRYGAETPVIGLESGSERIISKYMRGKPFPYRPEQWGEVIVESARILADNHVHACYTMTIGYPDETDEDVEKSIRLVEDIIESGVKVWVFPLPVIPITSTRLAKNPFPALEKLPSKYWELLYIAWKHDLKVTRDLMPGLNARLNNGVVAKMVEFMTDRIFSSIEDVFKEFMETKGRKAYDYSKIDLSGMLGAVKSVYWLSLSVINKHREQESKGAVSVSS